MPVGLPWEVVVIDNNSTDDTAIVAVNTWADCSAVRLRVVHEARPGLSYARECAFRESRYDIVAFVDDDNWVCATWIALVHEIMSEHAEVGACGGSGTPVFEGRNEPSWFSKFQLLYATGEQTREAGYVPTSRGALYGAGLSIRKSAWEGLARHGFEPTLSGRKGAALSSGEDTELCYALQLAGWKLWYDPRLTFEHYITAGRLEWAYLLRMNRGSGESRCWVDIYARQLSPENQAFRHIPISPEIAGRIRDTWLYQVYSRFRALRNLRAKARKSSNDDAEMREVVTAYVDGHLRELLRNPLSYMRFKARLRKASWRKQVAAGSQGMR